MLQCFQEAGLKLKLSKCHFFQREVKFLGFHVSADGIKPLDENVNRVVEWPTPRNQTDVWAFLGLNNYYRRFIQHYSQKAQPLICLTRQDVLFNWTDHYQKAFDQLKQELTSPSIMAHPKAVGLMILDTDTSKDTIVCVLSQCNDTTLQHYTDSKF